MQFHHFEINNVSFFMLHWKVSRVGQGKACFGPDHCVVLHRTSIQSLASLRPLTWSPLSAVAAPSPWQKRTHLRLPSGYNSSSKSSFWHINAAASVAVTAHRLLLRLPITKWLSPLRIWPNRRDTRGMEIALISAGARCMRACGCTCVCMCVCVLCVSVCVSSNLTLIWTFDCYLMRLAAAYLYILQPPPPPFFILKQRLTLKYKLRSNYLKGSDVQRNKANKGGPSSLHKPG